MPEFSAHGSSYLVCPRLLELDARHGRHMCGITWPLRQVVTPDHPLRELLTEGGVAHVGDHHPDCECLMDWERHTSQHLAWRPGDRPYLPEEWPHCDCGRALVHADLDHPGAEHDPASCPRANCQEKTP